MVFLTVSMNVLRGRNEIVLKGQVVLAEMNGIWRVIMNVMGYGSEMRSGLIIR